MKKLLLKIGRKIDLFYFNLLSIHGDLRGKYPLYRVLERLSRLILSLPFRTVPGLKVARPWGLALPLVFNRSVSEVLDTLGIFLGLGSLVIAIWLSDRIAYKIVEWLRHFRWFRRIIGE
jgi:hypothetical protein